MGNPISESKQQVNNPKVCSVIVTFNRKDLLKKAVTALKNQTISNDIVVINNGSTDGTDLYLQNETGITVITQENLGGAGGFHRGMKFAAENNYDFVWIMDDDVAPNHDALEEIWKAYEIVAKKGRIGFICSSVFDPEGNPANHPDVDLSLTINGFPEWNRYLDDIIVKVSHATFVSVFIPVENLYEVGLPYKEFFIWGDDTEFTGRLSSRYPSYLAGKSKVTHFRVGGQIDLVTMNDFKRARMIRFQIRNDWFRNKGGLRKTYRNFRRNFKLIGRLVKSNQFKKIPIVIEGMVAGMRFKPVIEYPQKQ